MSISGCCVHSLQSRPFIKRSKGKYFKYSRVAGIQKRKKFLEITFVATNCEGLESDTIKRIRNEAKDHFQLGDETIKTNVTSQDLDLNEKTFESMISVGFPHERLLNEEGKLVVLESWKLLRRALILQGKTSRLSTSFPKKCNLL